MNNHDDGNIDYGDIMHEAVLLIIRRALAQAQAYGLGNTNHFYISFYTQYEGVKMPEYLKAQNGEEMTIVLQYRYWNLQTDEHGFSVDLSFNHKIEQLYIPYEALTSFADPFVPIGFKMSEWSDEAIWQEVENTTHDDNYQVTDGNQDDKRQFYVVQSHENVKNSTHDVSSLFKLGQAEHDTAPKHQKNKDGADHKVDGKDGKKPKKSKSKLPNNVINLEQFRDKKDK